MNLLTYIKGLFHKEKPVITKFCPACNQQVDPKLYNKKLKNHVIGQVRNKFGMTMTLCCDGEEI